MLSDNFGTWLEIDLGRLENNFHILSNKINKPIMPVVKANAYGHGIIQVAERLEKIGANWFGVARIEEGLKLREVGIQSKILVLGYTSPRRVPHAIQENISLCVYDTDVARQYAEMANGFKKKIQVHAKIDTGMGRLGIQLDRAISFCKLLNKEPGINFEGLFTHFARADEPNVTDTDTQLKKFKKLLADLDKVISMPSVIHCANSAGALLYPESRFDLVRVGIVLYGLPPSRFVQIPIGVEPALSWKTRLISKKTLPAGHGVSYGFKYHTSREELVGVIAAGYGDGLRRMDGNSVLIRGIEVPIIGIICMDQSMVRLDAVPEAEIGDEVVLLGKQNGVEITATGIAEKWGTIDYEVICGLASRMPRYYRN